MPRASRVVAVIGPTAVVTLVCAVTLWNVQVLASRDDAVAVSQQVRLGTADLVVELGTTRASVRQYVDLGDTADLAQAAALRATLGRELGDLRRLTRDNRADSARLDRLGELIAARLRNDDSLIAVRRNRGRAEAMAMPLTRARAIMDTVRTVAGALTASATAELGRRTASVNHQRRLTSTMLVVGAVFAILLGLVANGIVRRGAAWAQRGVGTTIDDRVLAIVPVADRVADSVGSHDVRRQPRVRPGDDEASRHLLSDRWPEG
ncbi:MAG TPA: CHASE3 domain-containing protein [Gemmatimonadaceae bacterium]|jgi:CHASE3 domain sensor protein|nr:CHASE3 domain-containing protein [Gemmatimonadaceae bacterium]